MKNILKGFIIGIGKIIPGVSGAMLAISLGVYDKALYYINNFFKHKKESIKYLFPLGIGILISIIIFSKIIDYTLSRQYVITMLFFIGLLLGGLPSIINKVQKKDYYLVILSFSFFFILSITNSSSNYIIQNNFIDRIILFLSGIVEAISTIVPGISGTAMLMIIGTYDIIIKSLSNILSVSSIKILVPLSLGIIIGIIITIKIIDYLFQKYNNKVYAFVLGVFLSSTVLLIIKTFTKTVSILNLIIGIIFLILGIIISTILEK